MNILKNKIKRNKGITGVDVTIAIIIIAIFTGLIANLMYSSYKTAVIIQKSAKANAYATMILEKVDEKAFDEIDPTNFVTNLKTNGEISIDGDYTVDMTAEDYGDYRIDGKYAFKKISLTISYNVSSENKKLIINKLKVREVPKEI